MEKKNQQNYFKKNYFKKIISKKNVNFFFRFFLVQKQNLTKINFQHFFPL